MTAPDAPQPETDGDRELSPLLRSAIWVAIGALIAAAIVCVVWVVIGGQDGIVGRAFLTILLLVAFAGVAIMDAHLAARRPAWFALASMVTWIVSLLIGAYLIWMPTSMWGGEGYGRFLSFLLIVLVLQLALLHVRLYWKAHERHPTGFSSATTYVTVALVVILALMLVAPLTFWEFVDFPELYWRIVVAVTILAAVGTALVPLVNALFAPRRARPAPTVAGYAPAPWPTYADGATPLPVMPDGTPDWNAYYTGRPTYAPAPPAGPPTPAAAASHPAAPPAPFAAPQAAPAPAPSAAPGYAGYPPPPPPPA